MGVHRLLLICTPTAPHAMLCWLCALCFFHCWSPLAFLIIHLNFISLWFVYMLSLLIFFLLPSSRDLFPAHGCVLVNLEIDLPLRDGSDLVCSWNKRNCHLDCILFHTKAATSHIFLLTGFLFAPQVKEFLHKIEKLHLQLKTFM